MLLISINFHRAQGGPLCSGGSTMYESTSVFLEFCAPQALVLARSPICFLVGFEIEPEDRGWAAAYMIWWSQWRTAGITNLCSSTVDLFGKIRTSDVDRAFRIYFPVFRFRAFT